MIGRALLNAWLACLWALAWCVGMLALLWALMVEAAREGYAVGRRKG